MSVAIILSAAVSFVLVFVLQAILARLFRPHNEDKFIIGLFVMLPLCIFTAVLALSWAGWLGSISYDKVIVSYLLFFVISSSWVASYPAVYASCPTLIMSYIIRRRPQGTSVRDMEKWLSVASNSQERVDDALSENLIRQRGESIELTSFGRLLFFFFHTYKRVLGLHGETL